MIQSMFVFALSAILASSSISTTANFRTSRPVIRTKRHNGFIYLKEPFQICTMEAVKAFNGEVCMIFICMNVDTINSSVALGLCCHQAGCMVQAIYILHNFSI